MKKILLGGTAAFGLLCAGTAMSQDLAYSESVSKTETVVEAPAEPVSTAAKLTIGGSTTFHMSLFQQDANTAGGDAQGNASSGVFPSGKGQGYNFSLDDSFLDFTFAGKTEAGLDYKGRINFTGQTGSSLAENNYSTRSRVRQNYVELGFGGAVIQGGNLWGTDTTSINDGSAVMGGDGGFGSNWSSRFNEPFTEFGSTGNMIYGAYLGGGSQTATKVTVMTPTVMGFHAAASFTPNTAHSGDIYQNNAANQLGNQSSFSNGQTPAVNAITPTAYFDQNHQAYSLAFAEQFGDLNVSLTGATVLSTKTKSSVPSGAAYEDTKGYMVGGVLSAYGLNLGVGYYDNKKTGVLSTDAALGKDGGKVFDAAIGWSYGPCSIAAGYLNGERNITDGKKATANIYSLTADMRIADGLTIYGDLNYADMKDDSITDSVDGTNKSQNKGTVFLLGTRVTF